MIYASLRRVLNLVMLIAAFSQHSIAETADLVTDVLSEQEAAEIIGKSFQKVFRRAPDPEGFKTYMNFLLHEGKDEAWLVKVLSASPEGRELARKQKFRLRVALAALFVAVASGFAWRRFIPLKQRQDTWKRWAMAIWLLVLVNGVAASLLFEFFTPANRVESSWAYLMHYANQRCGSESWKAMHRGVDQIRAWPEEPLYTRLLSDQGIKFQYPPTSMLWLDIFQRMTGDAWIDVNKSLNRISRIAVLGIGLCCGVLLYVSIRRVHADVVEHGGGPLAWMLVGGVLLTLTFYPITRSYNLGQAQTILTLLSALSLLAWLCHRRVLAGVLLAMACSIKPQYGVAALWAFINRQWLFAGAFSVTLGVFALTSALAYGFHHWHDYLIAIFRMGGHGESFHANQSVNGLVNRLLFNGNNLSWDPSAYPPFNPVVYYATLLSSLVLLLLALFWAVRRKPGMLDYAIVLLSLIMASPIAWEHHYGILLPVLVASAPVILHYRAAGRYTWLYLTAVLFLTSHLAVWTWQWADTRFNFIQSHLFAGSLMLLILLYRTAHLQARDNALPGA